MATLGRVLVLVAAVLVLGSVVFLVTWDIPSPTRQVEEIVPDDKLPH